MTDEEIAKDSENCSQPITKTFIIHPCFLIDQRLPRLQTIPARRSDRDSPAAAAAADSTAGDIDKGGALAEESSEHHAGVVVARDDDDDEDAGSPSADRSDADCAVHEDVEDVHAGDADCNDDAGTSYGCIHPCHSEARVTSALPPFVVRLVQPRLFSGSQDDTQPIANISIIRR